MSEPSQRRINPWSVWALVAIMMGGLVVYYSWLKNVERQLAEGRPPRLRLVKVLPLVDHRGQEEVIFDNDGKFYLVGYFYAGDEEEALAVCRRLEKMYAPFAGDPRIELLGVTMAPDLDTPGALKAFADKHGYTAEHWRFATATDIDLRKYMNKEFRYPNLKKPDSERKTPTDLYARELRISLVDERGEIRGVYWSGNPAGEVRSDSRCEADLRFLLAESAAGKEADK